MIVKYIQDNQLYLYINGKFIYKKWLFIRQSFVFDYRIQYGTHF
jgi:hypothetical protein